MTQTKGAPTQQPAPTATAAMHVTADTHVSCVTGRKGGDRQGEQPKSLPPHKLSREQVCTPVNVQAFGELLHGFEKREYLVKGFTEGFRIHYEGGDDSFEIQNSKSTNLCPQSVDRKKEEEVNAGRIKGPFKTPPFHNFKCSPIALREKSTPGTYRLLHNLSAPYDSRSVNFSIPSQYTTVQYATLKDAISLVQEVGQGAWMVKGDIKSAFRIVPLHKSHHHLMGFKWRNNYYYDTCLAMGLAESCRIFETVSDGLAYIFKTQFGVQRIVKILDDFCFIDPTFHLNAFSLKVFKSVTALCGIPIAWDKTSDEPSNCLVFYGAEIDSNAMQVALPEDKLQRYSALVASTINASHISVRELQSLVGKLQYATCVVTAGNAFLHRLRALIPHPAKPFWRLRLTTQAKKDLKVWQEFLQNYNGLTIIRQTPIVPSNALNMLSDASDLGYAAVYGSEWIMGEWPSQWKAFPIAVRELYPIMLIVSIFGEKLKNSCVLFHCDNKAIVAIINKQSSRDAKIMSLLRPLILALLVNNIKFKAVYITSADNNIVDSISRLQVTDSFLSIHGLRLRPYPVPEHLLPDNLQIS